MEHIKTSKVMWNHSNIMDILYNHLKKQKIQAAASAADLQNLMTGWSDGWMSTVRHKLCEAHLAVCRLITTVHTSRRGIRLLMICMLTWCDQYFFGDRPTHTGVRDSYRVQLCSMSDSMFPGKSWFSFSLFTQFISLWMTGMWGVYMFRV